MPISERPDPAWLDRRRYPFAPHYLALPEGRMHYVDEGDGPPVLMLHGNPTWSFTYRHLIRALTPRYRCVAPDYLGFGLSDRPAGWSYRPEAHAVHVETLIDALGLDDLTLVVHDWGGPLGLSYALRHPARVRRLVVMNTWCWPLDDDPLLQLFSKTMGGPLGPLLIDRWNLFARVLLYAGFGNPLRLTPALHRAYLGPSARPEERVGHRVFAHALTGATPWLRSLRARCEGLAGRPTLLLWGMRDPAFRTAMLRRWIDLLPDAQVARLDGVGHYVAEDGRGRVEPVVRRFLAATDA